MSKVDITNSSLGAVGGTARRIMVLCRDLGMVNKIVCTATNIKMPD